MEILIYIAIGLLSGVVSGMGIGGGTILIPALSIIFDIKQQTAQQINLIYFVPTAIVALITHAKQGNIEKDPLKPIIAFGLIGAAAGSYVALWMTSDILRKSFGFFLLAMGVYEFFRKEEKTERSSQNG